MTIARLRALQALAIHPATPACEAEAARAALERLEAKHGPSPRDGAQDALQRRLDELRVLTARMWADFAAVDLADVERRRAEHRAQVAERKRKHAARVGENNPHHWYAPDGVYWRAHKSDGRKSAVCASCAEPVPRGERLWWCRPLRETRCDQAKCHTRTAGGRS